MNTQVGNKEVDCPPPEALNTLFAEEMIELLLYDYWHENLSDTPALKLTLDGCFDPQDQDHGGVNFLFRIEKIEGATLYDAWSDESAFDDFYEKLSAIESGGQTALRIPPENDSYILVDKHDDCAEITIFLRGVITAQTNVTISGVGVSEGEFDNFMKEFRLLMDMRRKRDEILGFR